jgi:hypothetical protein
LRGLSTPASLWTLGASASGSGSSLSPGRWDQQLDFLKWRSGECASWIVQKTGVRNVTKGRTVLTVETAVLQCYSLRHLGWV